MATEQGGVYFPARAGFCDDQCARQVRRRFGHEGFDAYVTLLCLLLREDGGRLALSTDDDWEDLSDQLYGMGRETLASFIAVLQHYGAVVYEDGRLWSPLVSGAIATYRDTKEQRSRAGKASAEARKRKREQEKAKEAGPDAG